MNWSFLLGGVVNEPTNNVAGDSWKIQSSSAINLTPERVSELALSMNKGLWPGYIGLED